MAKWNHNRTGTFLTWICAVTALVHATTLPSQAQYQVERVLPLPPEAPSNEDNVLRYGEFDIRPFLSVSAMYDDNIFIASSGEEADLLWIFTPGVLLGSGAYRERDENYVVLSYQPDFIVFTDNRDQNDVDHDARFGLQRRPGNWTLLLQQDFATFTGSQVDVGARVDEQLFTTVAGAQYEISPKTSVELKGHQILDDYDGIGLDGYNEWFIESWADFALTDKLRLGGGLTGGILDVRGGGGDQDYQQPLARVQYDYTPKVALRASGGVEFRQFEDGGEDRTEGVFAMGSTYQPFENTYLDVDVYRANHNSISLLNQNYRSTGIKARVRQDLKDKYHLHLGGGIENLDYYATRTGVAAVREDDFIFIRAGASWDVWERLNVGVFYQFRDNDSNSSSFDFVNHQTGVSVAYQY